MRYKHFKNADVRVSVLGLGSWGNGGADAQGNNFYGRFTEEDCLKAMDVLIGEGVNLIDTAPAYGWGSSERLVGEGVKGKRDKVLISTKCGLLPDPEEECINSASYPSVIRQCEESLKNLQTDYIDFYFIHEPDRETPVEETMGALEELRRQGKIRFTGLSNFSKEETEEAMKYGRIDVIQPSFSLLNQTNKEMILWAKEQGIDSMSYGTLGGGILSGIYRQIPEFEENDIRNNFYSLYYREPVFSNIMKLLETMDAIAKAHNRPVSQVAVNWSTQQPYIGTALIGAHNAGKAKRNCEAFEWTLTDDEISKISLEAERLGLTMLEPSWDE